MFYNRVEDASEPSAKRGSGGSGSPVKLVFGGVRLAVACCFGVVLLFGAGVAAGVYTLAGSLAVASALVIVLAVGLGRYRPHRRRPAMSSVSSSDEPSGARAR